MCGRFTQFYTWSEVHAAMSLTSSPANLRPRYNIAPTNMVDAVRLGENGRELVQMQWGLVPSWWKKPLRDLPATFNARSDTVADKPMFREAFKRRRCIIPASGYYEWTGPKTDRQPHLFTAADGSPVLAFAGLWDRWRDRLTGEELLSCTMIVSDGNAWMAAYHDRMPVILEPVDFDGWLDGSIGAEVLRPAPESMLREWLVSKCVNSSRGGVDDATLIEHVEGLL